MRRAFRAKVRQVHPDVGGDVGSFLRVCEAYKQVLEELDREPLGGNPGRAREPQGRRVPRPPDPAWQPDLIVVEKPPDPTWEPDLVVPDRVAAHRRPPPDPRTARTRYASWFLQVSERAARQQPARPSERSQTLGLIILVGVMLASIALCWAIWHKVDRMEAEARRTSHRGSEPSAEDLNPVLSIEDDSPGGEATGFPNRAAEPTRRRFAGPGSMPAWPETRNRTGFPS